MKHGNLVIGQSGGPTSVINSSLAGVIEAALESGSFDRVLGMNFGIEGLMEERFFDLGKQSREVIRGLRSTPGSALSSSRHKLQEEDFPRILEVLKKYDIRVFMLIGGNDTMDTVHRVEAHCRKAGYELRGIGIPKTVDNDLFGTDHTPGFASAARSNILNVRQGGVLARDMRRVDQFVVYQTIGRDAGWLAAATALARQGEGDGPHLIYMPERRFTTERFIADAEAAYAAHGWVSVVCGEGITYPDGTPVSASKTQDRFSNTEFGAMGGASVALQLHRMLREHFGWRGEFQITESLIMSDAARREEQDAQEAYECGRKAVSLALDGVSGVMVSIQRVSDNPYSIELGTAALEDVAVRAKPMPDTFINETGNYPSQAFIDYCTPLISKLPEFTRLEDKMV